MISESIDVQVATGFDPANLLARCSSRSSISAGAVLRSLQHFVPIGEAPTMMTRGCSGKYEISCPKVMSAGLNL